jgi:hypothetical protein
MTAYSLHLTLDNNSPLEISIKQVISDATLARNFRRDSM